jgi:hypothetical protein
MEAVTSQAAALSLWNLSVLSIFFMAGDLLLLFSAPSRENVFLLFFLEPKQRPLREGGDVNTLGQV